VLGSLGVPEIAMILVVALLLFGPRKMPQIGRTIGRALGEFRRASNDFKRTIEDEVAAEDLRDVKQSLDEVRKFKQDIRDLGSLKNLDAPRESDGKKS
jgi:TatA/E family protein of Tat protein translocase